MMSPEMLNLIYALTAVVGTVITLYLSIIRPRALAHKAFEASQAERERISDGLIFGVKGIPGVSEDVKTGAERLQAVEQVAEKVVQGQALLEQRMNEANGTARRTEKNVAEIRAMLEQVVIARTETKLSLDTDAANVATLAAASQDELLQAIHHPGWSPS